VTLGLRQALLKSASTLSWRLIITPAEVGHSLQVYSDGHRKVHTVYWPREAEKASLMDVHYAIENAALAERIPTLAGVTIEEFDPSLDMTLVAGAFHWAADWFALGRLMVRIPELTIKELQQESLPANIFQESFLLAAAEKYLGAEPRRGARSELFIQVDPKAASVESHLALLNLLLGHMGLEARFNFQEKTWRVTPIP